MREMFNSIYSIDVNHSGFSSGGEFDEDITDVCTKPGQKYTGVSIRFLAMQAPTMRYFWSFIVFECLITRL